LSNITWLLMNFSFCFLRFLLFLRLKRWVLLRQSFSRWWSRLCCILIFWFLSLRYSFVLLRFAWLSQGTFSRWPGFTLSQSSGFIRILLLLCKFLPLCLQKCHKLKIFQIRRHLFNFWLHFNQIIIETSLHLIFLLFKSFLLFPLLFFDSFQLFLILYQTQLIC
jgi:hypothetical protein